MAAVSRVDAMAPIAAPVISASPGPQSAIVDANASDASQSRVCAAVSVSAVDIQDSGGVRSTTAVTSSHPASSGDVHIVPIVHITNTAASISDASSIGNSSMVMPPPAVVTEGDVSSSSALPTTRTDHPPTTASPVEVKKPRRDLRRRPPRPAPPVPTSHQTADLPDILHSHLPPPYCTLEPPSRPPRGAPPAPPYLLTSPGDSPPRQIPPIPASRSPLRNSHCLPEEYNLIGVSSRRLPYRTEEDDGKSCCGLLVSQAVSIRWFIIMISFVGLCCAVVGTVLGALKATGREHLTVSLLMIGVGIVLITVSGIAWRLTSRDSPPCRVMLGLARDEEDDVIHARRFSQRIVPGYGRPHHPYAAMVYPEFQFRPPPPSYHASMQAYRLGLLLDRHGGPPAGISAGAAALSPPPLYRSHIQLRPMVNTLSRDSERSQPPSYHSRQSSVNPPPPGGSAASGGTHHHHLPIASSSHQQSMASHLAAAVAEAQSRHSRNPSVLSFLSHESLTYAPPPPLPPAPQHTLDHPAAALVFPAQQQLSLEHCLDDAASDSSPTAAPPSCGRAGNSKRRNKSQKPAGGGKQQRVPVVVTSSHDVGGPVKGQSADGGDAAGRDLVTIVTTDGQLTSQDVSVVTVNAGRPSSADDEAAVVVVAPLTEPSNVQRTPTGEVQILAHL